MPGLRTLVDGGTAHQRCQETAFLYAGDGCCPASYAHLSVPQLSARKWTPLTFPCHQSGVVLASDGQDVLIDPRAHGVERQCLLTMRKQMAHIRDDSLRCERRVLKEHRHPRSIRQTHELPQTSAEQINDAHILPI